MRHFEAGLVDAPVAVEQQVEVDRTRPPARPFANAPEVALDLEQPVEQRARRAIGVELCDRVQEARLVGEAPRLGLADGREATCLEELSGVAYRLLAVAEVRAEADESGCHGRSAVTPAKDRSIPAGRTSGFRTRTFTRSGVNCSYRASATAVERASRRAKRVSATRRTVAATSR